MGKRFARISVFAGIAVMGFSSTSAGQTLDVKQARELLEIAIQGVWSFDVHVDVTRRLFLDSERSGKERSAKVVKRRKRASPFIDRRHYRQVFQRGKGRIEFLDGPGGKPTQYVVYDREVEKTWNPRLASSLVREPVASIVGEGEDYSEAFRTAYGRQSLLKSLRERSNVVLKDDGAGNIVLETAPVPPGGDVDLPLWGFRVSIDSSRGFMPRVLERFQEVKGHWFVVRRTTVAEAKKIGAGVWVPVKVTTQTFDFMPDLGTFGQMYHEVLLTVNLERSSWNNEIPEEAFELPTPTGTKVTDQFRQAQYVTGSPDPGKNLKDIAAEAKDLVPVVVAGGTHQAGSAWASILAIACAGLVASALLIFYLRRRVKQRGAG